MQTYTFTYDGDLQQRRAHAPDGSEEIYLYDPAGGRTLALRKNASGSYDRLRFWFGETEIWYGSESKEWAHLSHELPIARIENGQNLEFTYHSVLGSLLASVDMNGNVTGGFTYGPWGEILDYVGQPAEHLRRFNGKEADQLSGLSYYGYRYYDPLSLTWTSTDPLYRFAPDASGEAPRSANLYAFTLNNPLGYVDPDGRQVAPPNYRLKQLVGEGKNAARVIAKKSKPYVSVGAAIGRAIISKNPYGRAALVVWDVGKIVYDHFWGDDDSDSGSSNDSDSSDDNDAMRQKAIDLAGTGKGPGALPGVSLKKPTTGGTKKKRVSSKTLRRRWEKKHKKKWPKDPKTGKNQDASHKKALADEGDNDVDNIEPLPHDEHVRQHSEAGDFRRWGARAKKED